jgi:hypothetical protein
MKREKERKREGVRMMMRRSSEEVVRWKNLIDARQ